MGTHSAKKTSKDSINRLEIFNQSRPRLQAIAYRMLGSIVDAEDMVQETFIKWQYASLPEIKNPPAYLTTIITRLCIDRLRSARVQREQSVGTWLPEPIVSNNFEPPRFHSSVNNAQQLTEKFIQACDRGDLSELIALLAADVTFYSDGGGKVTALLKPMQGAIKVARFLIALRRSRLTPDYTFKQVGVNGQAGVICVADNQIESVITFEIVGCYIHSIYVVRNPDKLNR